MNRDYPRGVDMKQPDWCNYPDATVRMFGCWSLVNGLVKDEDFCKDCDCHVKLRKFKNKNE